MSEDCAAGCGVPMDPVLIHEGWTMHPACEFPELALQPGAVLDSMRAVNAAWNARHPRSQPGASQSLWRRRGGRQRGAAAAKVEDRPQGSPQVLTSRTDRVTQLRAARDALPKSGTRRREVYDAILTAGRRGLTHAELSDITKRSYSLNGPRVRELVTDGHVIRAPGGREGPSGSIQDVWVAVVNVPELVSDP